MIMTITARFGGEGADITITASGSAEGLRSLKEFIEQHRSSSSSTWRPWP